MHRHIISRPNARSVRCAPNAFHAMTTLLLFISSHVSHTGCAYYYDLQVEYANLVKEQNGLANVDRPLGGDAGLSILDAADHNAR